jgi:hypothetical protein
MKTKLIILALCWALIIVTSSCGKPEPVSSSGGGSDYIDDTRIYYYYNKNEIILAFWENISGFPLEANCWSGDDSITYIECGLTKSNPTVELQCFAKFDIQSGKGKVNINGENFDISNGRLFLINSYVKPIKVSQISEPLYNFSVISSTLKNLAKNNKTVAAFLADSKKSYEKNKSKDLKKKD